VFLFAGDELGYADVETEEPALDRHGRDRFRVPMRWDAGPNGGFTTGTPWLAAASDLGPSVATQARDPESFQSLVTAAVALHTELGAAPAELLDSPEGTIVMRRGNRVTAVNLGDAEQPAPPAIELRLEARPGDGADLSVIPGHGGWVATLRD
jgi:glycosidase